ncbi:hypothetical protein [Methylocella sp. CPCC 101449]|uniref:hypothetical protein n=1 Tax=Methylocella sp. CPCC 101449 TaxID=2987531 RepID=UPI00288DE254|nr:hypothetical protein [Methylocella sp. CPCC 101449]MDT2021210.1 hypothetical protein [Methylocella sp. CPCC 101449]
MSELTIGLELADHHSISATHRDVVQCYNQDDCVSTEALRNWLEARWSGLVAQGTDVPHPPPGQDGPSEAISERQKRPIHSSARRELGEQIRVVSSIHTVGNYRPVSLERDIQVSRVEN